jgi:hypothetical protein
MELRVNILDKIEKIDQAYSAFGISGQLLLDGKATKNPDEVTFYN